VLGIFRRITYRKLSSSADSVPVKPPVLEKLEPRILLSGDGLLNIAPPDPFQDALLNTMPQVVQYAELLQTSEAVEEQIGADVYQPLFTLAVGDDDANDESDPAQTSDDLAVLPDDSDVRTYSQATATEAVTITAAEPTTNNSAVPSEDGSMPTYINDADLSIEYATSIEIRGPPTGSVGYPTTSNLSTYAVLDGFAESSDVEGLYLFKAPGLPGLQLGDPDISAWQAQIIYLDFDGEQNVIYNGPVSVGPFDVPAFRAPGNLTGQEQTIIDHVLVNIHEMFAGSGIIFTTERPAVGANYSSIYVGGDDSAFSEYGSFFGLAETVDVGNKNRADDGFVFSGELTWISPDASRLVGTIAHEVGHLVGYSHLLWDARSSKLSEFAATNTQAISLSASDEPIWAGGVGFDKSITVWDWSPSSLPWTALSYGITDFSTSLSARAYASTGTVSVDLGGSLSISYPDTIQPGQIVPLTISADFSSGTIDGVLGAGLDIPLDLLMSYHLPRVVPGPPDGDLAFDVHLEDFLGMIGVPVPTDISLNTSANISPQFGTTNTASGSDTILDASFDLINLATFIPLAAPIAGPINAVLDANLGVDLQLVRDDYFRPTSLQGNVFLNGSEAGSFNLTGGSSTIYVEIPSDATGSVSLDVGGLLLSNTFNSSFGFGFNPYFQLEIDVWEVVSAELYRYDFQERYVLLHELPQKTLTFSITDPSAITIPVSQPVEGTAFSIAGYNWDDDTSNGDEDGVMEAGESVRMQVRLRSNSAVTNVNATLTTSDSQVDITDSDVYYYSFDAGEYDWPVVTHDLDLNFVLTDPNTHNSDFTLNVTYEIGSQSYYQNLNFDKEFWWNGDHGSFSILNAIPTPNDEPSIRFRNNDDEIFQSSEEIHIQPLLKYDGMGQATHIDVTLLYEGTELRVDPDDERYHDMNPGDSYYPAYDDYFWIESNDFSFSGTVYLDVQVVYDEGDTLIIPDAIAITVEPAPVISVGERNWDFAVTAPGDDIAHTIRVHNSGSATMNVSDVSCTYGDTTVPVGDRSFTLAPGTYRDIVVTIHTGSIASGTMISREVIVTSDGRLADNTPMSDRVVITGLVSDSVPVFQVSGVTGGEYPDISGSWVVWSENRYGNNDIFAYNVATAEERQITTDPAHQQKPRISGDLIVWEDWRNDDGSWTNGDIYGFDLATQQEFPISTEIGGFEPLVGVDGNLVAFTRQYDVLEDEDGQQNSAYNLLVYEYQGDGQFVERYTTGWTPGSGYQTRQTADDDGDFSDGMLVFERFEWTWDGDGDWAMYLGDQYVVKIDFAAGDTGPTRVTDHFYYPYAAAEHRFVYIDDYEDPDGNSGEQVWLWDNGSVRRLTSPGTDENDYASDILTLGGDFVVYDDDYPSEDLLYYDLNTDSQFLLTQQVNNSQDARMEGNGFVWQGQDPSDLQWYIYYTFLQQPDIAVSSANLTFSAELAVEGDTIDVSILVLNLTDYGLSDDITVRLYDGDPDAGGEQLGSGQVISGGLAGNGEQVVSFTGVVIPDGAGGSDEETLQIYVRVSVPGFDNSDNNTASGYLTVHDNDTEGPSISNVLVEEYDGDGDGIIGADEQIRISWALSDPSGVGSTELSVDGSPISLSGDYYAVFGPLTAGEHNFVINTTDADASPVSSQHNNSFAVNYAPVVDAGIDQTTNEGSSVDLAPATFTNPDLNDTHAAITNWGDGTTAEAGTVDHHAQTVYGSHVYTDNGTYTITVTVTDDEGASASDTLTVTVNNVAPIVDAGSNQTADEGEVVSFSGFFTDPGSADTHMIQWNFGDGSTFTGTQMPRHTYADNGAYTVTLTVTDDDGGTTSDTLEVTVSNVAPTVEAGPDQTAYEGDTVNFNGAFTDPGLTDTHTLEWDLGDGSPIASGTLTPSHVYADNGAYTVTLTVTDDDGGTTSDTLEVTVNNVPPTVEAGLDRTVNEGDTVNFSGSFTDPGSADTHTVEWDFGDSSLANGTLTPSHVYADNGVYTVTLTVTDDEGVPGSNTFTVTVNNVAPTVEAGSDQTVTEGQTVSLDPATFNDLGTLDTHTATIDWGDGTAPDVGVVTETPSGPPGLTSGANGTVSGRHVYADDGTYTVTVTVTDNEGASGSDTLTVTVNNVTPTTAYTIIGDFCGPNFGPPDGYVDVWDLMQFADHWHTSTDDPNWDAKFDLAGSNFGDPDGYVDVWDLMEFADHWHLEAGSDKTVDEGQTLSLDAAAFNDPGTLDTHTATIDWGDGTVPDVGVVTETPFGPPGSASGADGTVSSSQHVYTDDGVYTVTVTVTDDEGLFGNDTLTVTVNNVAPIADAGLDLLALKLLDVSSTVDNEESEIGVTVSNYHGPETQPDGAVHLPGMQLVDPDISNWQGQIIYLDFDGAKGVVYNGPVAVGPFNVPAFKAPGGLAGYEQKIIDHVLAELKRTFAGTDIIFAISQPPRGMEYSTIYIGGNDSAFAAYGSFLGLAEQVDESNQDPTDDGFVFSDFCTEGYADVESLADTLAGLIAHETGHLLGFVHNDLTQSSTPGKLAPRTPYGSRAIDQLASQFPEAVAIENGIYDVEGSLQVNCSGRLIVEREKSFLSQTGWYCGRAHSGWV